MKMAVIALAASALSCATIKIHRIDPATGQEELVVRVWIETSENLPPDELLKACEGWAAKGVRCVLSQDIRLSDVQVYDDEKNECKEDKDGMKTVATAYGGGKIEMFTPCMRGWWPFKSLDMKQVRAVFMHEIGHQLGIWDHVPDDCDPKKIDPKKAVLRTHPNGRQVCGQAVMNPAYDSNVTFITEFDGLAFEIRRKDWAVVSDPETPLRDPNEPICTYVRE